MSHLEKVIRRKVVRPRLNRPPRHRTLNKRNSASMEPTFLLTRAPKTRNISSSLADGAEQQRKVYLWILVMALGAKHKNREMRGETTFIQHQKFIAAAPSLTHFLSPTLLSLVCFEGKTAFAL